MFVAGGLVRCRFAWLECYKSLVFSSQLVSSLTYYVLSNSHNNSKLLSILAIGFAQGLYALDAADGETEHGSAVINALVQALLQYVFAMMLCP